MTSFVMTSLAFHGHMLRSSIRGERKALNHGDKMTAITQYERVDFLLPCVRCILDFSQSSEHSSNSSANGPKQRKMSRIYAGFLTRDLHPA
jgi:hypothetical protein